MRTEAWAFLVLLCFSFQGKEVEKKKKAKNARSPYGLCMGAMCPRCVGLFVTMVERVITLHRLQT